MTAERRETASPEPTGGAENPATAFQRTTDLTPDQAAGLTAVPEPGRAPAPPAAFGRYQVRQPLGAGGFGAVYLGHDPQLDRPVAIKVLHAGPGLPQAEAERALQEARRLAQLRHPGIVAVHDVGVHEGQVYIVSDYLSGPDLGRWLREHRPGWMESARIVAAVADALAHAHARLIVHRDVKPANILLTAERTPVLVDFGLGLDEARAGGREKGIVSGTPRYMSPEQAAGQAHRIDGRTDVYSLGVVLYEMLTGLMPFRSDDFQELLRQVRDDEPQPPRQLVRDLPPELERACLKAMAKRPQDRYTTAADFAEDLRRLTGPDEPAPPPARREAPRAREAERRQVTVLVSGCDLFESEAFLEHLDADDQAQVLRAFRETCRQAVSRFGGTVVQCDDQGLLACFGYPVAHEDAAQRAAHTGLMILDDIKAAGRPELRPWVGIHTGPAVVESGPDTVSLVGEARTVAVRLKDVAEAGQVVCTGATHQLLQAHFECAGLGSRKLKGVAQSTELFRVQAVAPVRNPIEAAQGAGLTPLTGRDQEVGLLKDRWEQAREGMGQVVLLIGEPGLGKSRLVHTLKQHVREQGESDAPVVEWRCSPHFQNTGLYPAIDFFERALAFGREEPPQARFDRLVRHLEQYDLARPQTVLLWASLLSLPTTGRFSPLSLSPTRQREETFRALLEWLHARAARRPVLFVVEDLHWVDASTLEFLGQFLAEGLHDSILTLFTFRPEFRTPWPAVAHQTSLALNRLTRRQVGELMRKKTGGELPEAVVQQVHDRTGGVPLFVEEFTKMVQESGSVARAHEVPATLQDLLMARLDRLEGDREVVQLAAALGREFSYELLAAVTTADEPALLAELDKLVRAEILYARGRPPRCGYLFKHALLEDAAYNSLIKGKRQQFHRRIAEVLQTRFPQTAEAQPEVLAHHFTEAGLTERAIGHWLQAGLRSRDRSANVEAIGHLTKGLELLATLDESPQRDARELEFLNPLGAAYQSARGFSAVEVGPVFQRAHELCQRTGEPQQRFAIVWGIWAWHAVRGDLRLCMDLAAEGMELAGRLDDPGIMMEALFAHAFTRFYRADFAGAHQTCARAVDEFDDQERTRLWAALTSHNSSVSHRCYLALSLWHLGYPDQALKAIRDMEGLARSIGQPFGLCVALHHVGWLHCDCRLGAEAQAAGNEAIEIAGKHGFPMWHATGQLFKGAGLLRQGSPGDALPLLLQGLGSYRAIGAGTSLPYFFSMLGDAYTQAGRFAEARQALDEGLAIADRNDDRFHEAELHRLRGELHLAETDDQAAAEGCFRTAIETARRQQSKAWELRATTSLARLWQRQGRRDEARGVLAAVYDTFTEGFTTPDLRDAATLLKALV